MAVVVFALDDPLYLFDNGYGPGKTLEQKVEMTRQAGYAGIFYSGTKDIAQLVALHKASGMRVLGIYTGMNVSDAKPSYDAGLPEAIKQLKGTGALITFTVMGKAEKGDEIAVPVIREVADMAKAAGLKVALYPHYGFHVARVDHALKVVEKVKRKNVGVVFNLCHWLRSGDEANMMARLKEAKPHMFMVSINGADHEGDWDRLIQTLDRGSFDVRGFVMTLRKMGYKGPFGLQCYNVKGEPAENLKRSMEAWRRF